MSKMLATRPAHGDYANKQVNMVTNQVQIGIINASGD